MYPSAKMLVPPLLGTNICSYPLLWDICLCLCDLHSRVLNALESIQGFDAYRLDRLTSTKKAGGGVETYTDSSRQANLKQFIHIHLVLTA